MAFDLSIDGYLFFVFFLCLSVHSTLRVLI